MHYNNEFKEIDTIEKAYFLGLFQADGSICINEKAYNICSKIKLKAEDKYMLDYIHNTWSFFTKPHLEIHKSGKEYYYIYSYNREFCNDLIKNGIFPRKSYENANKSFIPELNEKLFFSYFLGLLDGDGTVYMSKRGHIRIDLYGKTKNLFDYIINILKTYNIKGFAYYNKKKNLYLLRFSRKSDVQALIERFSKYSLCLKRKFKKYFNIDWSKVPGYDNRSTNNKNPGPH